MGQARMEHMLFSYRLRPVTINRFSRTWAGVGSLSMARDMTANNLRRLDMSATPENSCICSDSGGQRFQEWTTFKDAFHRSFDHDSVKI